jgi:molybdate transport system ATP-binding protein
MRQPVPHAPAGAESVFASHPGQPGIGWQLRVALNCTAPVPLQAQFDCEPGELVALVGPSGSGKTTLLRALAGLFNSPSLQGTVTVQGSGSQAAQRTIWFDSAQGINLPPQQRRVGLVFQQYALFAHLSAIDNIALCAENTWTVAEKYAQSIALLQRMGLGELAQRMPHQLSGGQQQRVALARALVRLLPLHHPANVTRAVASSESTLANTVPGVLLLDEPFSAVDAPMRQILYRELAQLHASLQLPIVLVTHDLAEARRLADRVVIVDAGTTLQSGPPERVLRSPRNARVAQLVGLHNHFAGQFFKAPEASVYVPKTIEAYGRLHWGAHRLLVADKSKIDNNTAVTWVLAGDAVQILQTQPTAHEASEACNLFADNYLPCQLSEMLPLGEICVCKLTVADAPAADAVILNLSTAMLRGFGARVGSTLILHIPPQAVHIMPVRGESV